jgi:hypothetical protein
MPRPRLKRVLVILLVVFVVLVVAVLLPPVQNVLLSAVVGGIEGVEFGVDRVWAGPWGGEVEGLRVQAAGLEMTVERAEADLAFWSSLSHLSLDVEEASATGVDIHIGPFAETGQAEASEPFEFRGLARVARVPRRVVVRSAEADGTITVTVSDTLELTGPWSVAASNLGPDRRLEGMLESTLEARRAGTATLAAVIDTSLTSEVDGSGAVRKLAAAGGIHSLGDQPVGLDADVELELADEEESYRLTVDGSGGHRLVEASAQFGSVARVLDASWQANLTPGLVTAFARDRAVPELWGESTGSAELDLEAGRLTIDARTQVKTREWGKFDPRLVDWVELDLELDLAGVLSSGRLDARRLRLGLIPAGDPEILSVEALGPLTLEFETLVVTPEVMGEPAIRIEMNRFPLDWVRRFNPAIVVVEQGAVDAALDVVPLDVRHGKLVAREPIRAEGLQLSPGRFGLRPLPVDVTIVPRMEYDRGQLEAEIESFEMTADTGLRVRFKGEAVTSLERWPVVDLNGYLAMRIPKLRAAVDSLDVVGGNARFALDLAMKTLALDSAVFGARGVSGRPLIKFEFENDLPLTIALPSMVADWEGSSTQELNIRFDGLPIGWISPFIPELEFEGGALYGELEVDVGGGRGLSLQPVAPFEVRGLRPIYRGILLTDDATLSLQPRLRLDNTEAQVLLDEIKARTPKGGRIDGQMDFRMRRDRRRRIDTTFWFEGEFPALTGRIGRIGALSWRQRGTIDVANRRIEVDKLDLGLTDVAGTRFLELGELRPFVMSAEPFGVWVDGGSPDIVIATITPLELQQLFPRVFGFELEGVLPQGQFLGRAENGGLLLVAEDELVFKDVSVRWEEAALLDRVTVGLSYEVFYSTDGLQARTIEFSTLGPRGTPIADATLRAVMPLTDRTTIDSLSFETVADLEPLARQPIFAGLPAFLEGTVGGSVDVSYGDRSTLQAEARLRGARVEDAGTLPNLDMGLGVVTLAGESLDVSASLGISSDNGLSDLGFEGDVRREGDGFRFKASLTGDRLVAADVTRLVHVVAPPEPDSGSSASRDRAVSAFRERWSKSAIDQIRERRDSEPFWGADVSGDGTLDLVTLELARTSIDGIRGRVEVDPGAIEMTGVEASMLGARFSAEGGLRFDGTAEDPYTLHLASSFEGLDLGRLFRTVVPDEPPTLEGVYDVYTSASGEGRNPADLGLGTLGEMRVSGRDGVFRGLAGQYTLVRRGTKVLGFLTFSKQLKAVSRLLGELEALEFDNFDLVLARETPRRFAISELTVVSPLARVEGEGGVEVEPGVPLVESPLAATLDMATRGDMTVLFDGLGLLQEGTDEHGYRPLTRPVAVGGTVAEPDTSEFYEMLDEAARDSKGFLGVGMRKVNKKLQKGRAATTQ